MNTVHANDTIAAAHHGDFSAPLGAITQGTLTLARGISKATLQADPEMPDLYRAHFDGLMPEVQTQDGSVTIRYPHLLPFDWARYALWWSRLQAAIRLSAAIPWHISIRGGISDLSADLRELRLLSLMVDGGASHAEMRLPRPKGSVCIRIGGGVSNVTLLRPADVAVCVRVGRGVSNLRSDALHLGAIGGGTSWTSPDYEHASSRYEIVIAGGASNLTIEKDRAV